MQNIEFKAELLDLVAARRQCAVLGAQRIGAIRQTDTYYKLHEGRLKKREGPGEPTEWIHYHRADLVRPRMCHYTILSDEQAKRRWGSQSLRAWLKVTKTRELWMLDNVRIHLDQVDRLGAFIEFEAAVSRKHDVQACHQAINHLRHVFGVSLGEPLAASYCDLMAQVLAEGGE
ncbi:MAG: class IV adenylate cyclase [Planctomycetota bacterium]|jgi:adenylate cyclase class IV